MFWLVKMRKWLRHPPSPKMVRLGLCVVLAAFALASYEFYFGWPEALIVNRPPRMIRP